MKGLTRKQKRFYEYVRKVRLIESRFPTYREIVQRFNYKSPNSAAQNIQALQKKGYLIKTENGWDITGRDHLSHCPYCNRPYSDFQRAAA